MNDKANNSDTIMLIDGDPVFRDELRGFLEAHGLVCKPAADATRVLAMIAEVQPALLLLDQRLGATSGIDVLRLVRSVSDVPCVILAGLDDPVDRILGLELGADDYIHKKALPREILARIRAVLRRTRLMGGRNAGVNPGQKGWELRAAEHELYRPDGVPCRLTFAEFTLLRTLVAARGEPLSRDVLSQSVFDRPFRPGDRGIDSLIVRLRRKLEPDPEQPVVIKSARQQGYLFTDFAPLQSSARIAEPASSGANKIERVSTAREDVAALCVALPVSKPAGPD